MRKRSASSILSENWQPVLLTVFGITAVGALLTYKLGVIAPFVAKAELNILTRSITDIFTNPLFLHQQIIQKLTYLFTSNELYAVRAPAIFNGLVAAAAFYGIVSTWYTKRIALMGSVLFVTSSWFLHVTRIGTTDSSYLLILVPLLASVYIHANRHILLSVVALVFSGLSLVYIPGLMWLLLPILIWQRKLILRTFQDLTPAVLGGVLLTVILGVLPLLVASVQNINFLTSLMAIPTTMSLAALPGNIYESVLTLFIRSDGNPLFGIASLPYVSIPAIALVALGVYQSVRERKLDRTKVLSALLLFGLLLHAFNDSLVSLALVLPFIFYYITSGLALLLRRWLTVFPKNSFAEKTALLCIVVVVGSMAAYELTRYFIAWPHSDGYTSIYSESVK